MFQFPRCPPRLNAWVPGRAPGGLPHSDIPGSQAASASPGHFAAWPRPSSAANAKASTMRPSCGFLHPLPSSVCRSTPSDRHAPAGRRPAGAMPVPRAGPRRCCVCVMCLCSARGRPPTSPAPAPISGRRESRGGCEPQTGLAISRGRRTPRVPRGALSRYSGGIPPTHRRAFALSLERSPPP